MSKEIIVPEKTRSQFPELVELILETESMDEAEKGYWIEILPRLRGEQLAELTQILGDERKALLAIDAKYAQEIEQGKAKKTGSDMKEKMKKIRAEEASTEINEQQAQESLIDELDKN